MFFPVLEIFTQTLFLGFYFTYLSKVICTFYLKLSHISENTQHIQLLFVTRCQHSYFSQFGTTKNKTCLDAKTRGEKQKGGRKDKKQQISC